MLWSFVLRVECVLRVAMSRTPKMRGKTLKVKGAWDADEVAMADEMNIYSSEDEVTQKRRGLEDPADRYAAHRGLDERIAVRRNLQVQKDMTTSKWWDKLTETEKKEYDTCYLSAVKGGWFKCVFVLETQHYNVHWCCNELLCNIVNISFCMHSQYRFVL